MGITYRIHPNTWRLHMKCDVGSCKLKAEFKIRCEKETFYRCSEHTRRTVPNLIEINKTVSTQSLGAYNE
jgi:hypothetical protein